MSRLCKRMPNPTDDANKMKVNIISCWFATSYGAYTDGLRRALERQLGNAVGIIASNCGCGDPVEVKRQFQDRRCEYIEFPHIHYYKSVNPLKFWLRVKARNLLYWERARRYLKHTGEADVLHFQQTLNAFGSVPLFHWLNLPSKAARVVTVHELDPYQQDFPETNLNYNNADRIIVHALEMKKELVSLGVNSSLIDIVEHGVEIRPATNETRNGIIFYAGHKLHSGKGLDTLFAAMALVKDKLGPKTPVLTIHGHYGTTTPEYGLEKARESGIENGIRWLNQISLDEAISEYQRSLLCVLPYTGSFAGFPAVTALANGVPVIGTRRAGLPEHLGDVGTWVTEKDAKGLATTILGLLENRAMREDIATRGRARAEQFLSWDVIAKKTHDSYKSATRTKAQQQR